jgi:predicted RNase H-like HicB family nuclease
MERRGEAGMVKHVGRKNLREAERAKVRRYAMVIEWSDEDQLFLVSIPDFPGAHTHGRTRAEAAEMGEEAIALLLNGESNPPAARFTAMDYPVRPEAEVRELAGDGRSG